MFKKKKSKIPRIIACVLAFAIAIPSGVQGIIGYAAKANAESGSNIVLKLSTDEILETVERVAGSEAATELENTVLEEDGMVPSSVAEALLPTTTIIVEPNEEVVAKDADGNSVTIKEEFVQDSIQYYYVDQKLEEFIYGITLPENSKVIQQGLMKALQGMWLIKTYEDEAYKAIVMLDPETMELQVFFVNASSSGTAFTLNVKDSNGKLIELTEVSAMLQKASSKTLTTSELEKYQSQEHISVEVRSALAESAVKQEDISLGDSGEEVEIIEESTEDVIDSVRAFSLDTQEELQSSDEVSLGASGEETPTDDATGKLTQVEAVLVETEKVETSSRPEKNASFTVPENTVFFGTFGGITTFGLNFSVEYFINGALYKEPFIIGSGQFLSEEPTPPNSLWPTNTTTFNGWYEAGSTTKFDFTKPVSKNIRLYGQFSNTYVITYKNEDGQVIDTKTVPPNGPVPETSKEISAPSGTQLAHWYIEGRPDTEAFVFGTAATKDLVLRPYFSNRVYVIFMSEGTQVEPQTVVINDKAKVPTAPTRKGYTFSHWSKTEGGAAYNFGTAVTENLILYAVWKPAQTQYKVLVWVEKANIAGDPGTNPDNYVYSETLLLNGTSGSKITPTGASLKSAVDGKIGASRVHALRFSEFRHSDQNVEIDGNGTTIINAYYKRINYTYRFQTSGNLGAAAIGSPVKTTIDSGGTSTSIEQGAVDLTLVMKYQQSIASIWPKVTRGTGVAANFEGWYSPKETNNPTEKNGIIWVTSRYTLTDDMIHYYNPQDNREYNIPGQWKNTNATATVRYYLESYDGSGELNTEDGRYYELKKEYNQTIITASPEGMRPKTLDGFTISSTKLESGYFYKFYYTRNSVNLDFNTMGGNDILSAKIPFEKPITSYKPADPIKAGYIFKGWFADATYFKPFDFNQKMPYTSVAVYAKWESTQFKVKYYDRLGSTNLVAEQGYALNEYVTYPAVYTVGQFYPGFGEFRGWKWKIPDTNITTDFSTGIPVQSNIDLYPNWKTTGFKVKYEAGTGTGTPPVDDDVYDINRNIALKQPSLLTPPPNEVFYGWYESTRPNGQLYYPRNLYEIQGTTTFIAKFGDAKNAYVLKFDAGYPGNTQGSVQWYVPKNTSVYLLNKEFTRPNAELIGWSETQGATTVQYDFEELVKITGNKTLYAVWRMTSFAVTFQADPSKGMLEDGATTIDKVVYANVPAETTWSSAITRGVPKPKANSGYYFTGWSPAIPAGSSQILADSTYVAQFATQTAITLKAESKEKTYDGVALTEPKITPSYLNTTLYKVEGTMTAASTITGAGTIANTIGSYKIIRKSDNADVTNEFNISLLPGTLKINPRVVTVKAESKTEAYTGALITANVGGTVTAGSLAPSQTLVATATGQGTAVGNYDITIQTVKVMSSGADVTANYSVTKENGQLTIGQRTGVMKATASDVNVTYDGTAHGINVAVTGVTGATVTYSTEANGTFTATQPVITNVADSKTIYFKVTHTSEATVTGSAQVKINARAVTVKAESKTEAYTGAMITANVGGTVIAGSLVPSQSMTVTATGQGTAVGNYDITIQTVKVMSSGADVTANYSVTKENGQLTIGQRTGVMKATASDVNVTYDGTAHGINVAVTGVTGATVTYSTEANGTFTATQPVITNVADSKTIYFKVTHTSEATVTGSAQVKINARAVTVKAESKTEAYTGAMITANVGGTVIAGSLAPSQSMTVTATGQGTAVGNYDITIQTVKVMSSGADVTANYSVTKENGQLTIGQRTGVMKATASDVNVTYDGTAHGINVAVTGVTGATVTYSTEANGTFTATQPVITNVADSKTIYFKVTHTSEATVTGSAQVKINARAVTVKAESKTEAYTGAMITANVGGTVIAGSLVPGQSMTVTATGQGTAVGNYDITIQTVKVMSSGADVTANYSVTKENGQLTIGQRTGVMKATASDVNVTYDGTAHGINVAVTGVTGATVTYSTEANGTFTATQPVITNVAESKTIYFKVTHTSEATVTGSAQVKINARAVTVKAESKTEAYTGAMITANVGGTVIAGSLVPSQSMTVTATGQGTAVGNYDITIQTVKVMSSGADVTANYSVTKENGQLTIGQRTGVMKATASDVNVTYDGTAHGINVAVTGVTGATVTYSTEANGTFTATQPVITNVADSKTIYFKVTHTSEATVTGSAQVKINARAVTVKAESKTEAYTGAMITANVGGTVIAGSLAPSQSMTVTATGQGTAVGNYDITIQTVKVMSSGADVTANYSVTKENGQLTIGQRTGVMKATASDVNVTYDGTAHGINVAVTGVTGATVTYSTEANGTFTATQPVITNVADSKTIYFKVTHTSEATVTGSAQVKINARAVTVTADDKTKQYGSVDPTLTATVGNLPTSGDALNYTLSRESGEAIGSSYEIKVVLGSNPNYAVTVANGILTIKQRSGFMTATASDVNVTYDGNAHGINVVVGGVTEGYTVTYSTAANGTFTATQPVITNVADSKTVYYKVTHANEATVTGSAQVAISQYSVAITVNSDGKEYLGWDPIFTASVGALPSNGVALNYTLSRNVGEAIGTYTITATLGDNPNYNVNVSDATFTIRKKVINFVVENATKWENEWDPEHGIACHQIIPQADFDYIVSTITLERDPGEAGDSEYEVRGIPLSEYEKYIVTVDPGVLLIFADDYGWD